MIMLKKLKHKLLKGYGLLFVIFLSACSPLERILYQPIQSPESWLSIQPVLTVKFGQQVVYIIQPSTSIIVYILGVLTIVFGFYFFRTYHQQKSRLWWGIALVLWGVGAILAGTSYEAFSYAIKCAGRAACVWTSWWEVVYLILSVGSVDAMLIAAVYNKITGSAKKPLIIYALGNFLLYVVLVSAGSLIPIQFLISFEFLIIILTPNIIILFIIYGKKYTHTKQKSELVSLGTWLGLILVIAAYFVYYLSGLTEALWVKGFWFSENDVLHIGLILWMVYIRFLLSPTIMDDNTGLVVNGE